MSITQELRISTTQRQRTTTQKTAKKEILAQAINEFQLPASLLGLYAELLDQLGFDLNPVTANWQTWYLCKGKQDRSPCRRIIPEIYFRTCVGKVLKAADKPETTSDNLVEELSIALSFAICEHHKEIHKVVRASEMRHIIDKWRTKRAAVNSIPEVAKEDFIPIKLAPHKAEAEPQVAQERRTTETKASERNTSETKATGKELQPWAGEWPIKPTISREFDPSSEKQVVILREPVSDKEVVEEPEVLVDELEFSKAPGEILVVDYYYQASLRSSSKDRRSTYSSRASSAGSRMSLSQRMRPRAESLHISWIAEEAQ